MRWTLLFVATLASGCAAPCSGPTQVSGKAYDLFATVLTFGPADNAEGFPADTTPANGASTWRFDWGGTPVGPITVLIDDQSFPATGAWDDVECGNFTVDLTEQTYTSGEADGAVEHRFSFSGRFLVYDDQIEGSGKWAEAWSTIDDAGTFTADELQLRGTLAGL